MTALTLSRRDVREGPLHALAGRVTRQVTAVERTVRLAVALRDAADETERRSLLAQARL